MEQQSIGADNNQRMQSNQLKFCKFCGEKIPMDAVICTKCGRQVEELKVNTQQPSIVINNDNSSKNTSASVSAAVNVNGNVYGRPGTPKNKLIAILLCIFLGYFGAHKFYEGKAGMGLLYLFTGGLFLFGIIIDFFVLLAKPSTYYVY